MRDMLVSSSSSNYLGERMLDDMFANEVDVENRPNTSQLANAVNLGKGLP